MSPVGMAIKPIPTMATNDAISFPSTVIGYISPYPTVVSVAKAHQIELPILLNTSGWDGFSA